MTDFSDPSQGARPIPIPDEEVYEALGEKGFAKLVAEFYRGVREDDLIGPMYPPDDWEGAETRLRDFLIFRFGGPPRYIEERGHPRLRGRHMPFSIGEAERDRWLELMDAAFIAADTDPRAAATLRAFFVPTADFMRNQ